MTDSDKYKLHIKAHAFIKKRPDQIKGLKPKKIAKLFQKLLVFQEELDLQNKKLRHIQGKLENSCNFFYQLYNSAPVGYMIIQSEGIISQANNTLAELLDMNLDDLRGRLFIDFIAPKEQQLSQARIQDFYRNPDRKNLDLQLRRRNGKTLNVRLRGRLVNWPYPNTDAETSKQLLVIVSDITELKRVEKKFKHQAHHDALTKLPNRLLLSERLNQVLAKARRDGQYSAVLFLDLDNFKTINDSLGHSVGDRLLIEVARRLRRNLRRDDTVARLGGDEFVVLLGNIDKDLHKVASQAHSIAEKVRKTLSEPYQIGNQKLHISASIGISLFSSNNENADDILKQADTAMYQAKTEGRNAFRFYRPEMQSEAQARMVIEQDLRKALDRGEFVHYYQAQVDTLGRIIGAEALLRWQHPNQGLIAPAKFMRVAEETGLIVPIGEMGLQAIFKQFNHWSNSGLGEVIQSLAVNVSLRQVHQRDFSQMVIEKLKDAAIDPQLIKIEITEDLMLTERKLDIDQIMELKTHGLRFSVDDFGTGYASLASLRRLPVDEIKIDRSFIRNVNIEPDDASIVETIIAMAQKLKIDSIAEGVERREQMDFLNSRGCDKYQGNYFSRPLPAQEFTSLLEQGEVRPIGLTH
ncbi:MAG: EAL domain-containing protein [Gammaproteobacteria bacterium]|nr:EAL domain-containing protein [Gammaproteobacteria bacterium]